MIFLHTTGKEKLYLSNVSFALLKLSMIEKMCELAKKSELPQPTARCIIKDKQKILNAVNNAKSLNSSIIRQPYDDNLESSMNVAFSGKRVRKIQ